MAEKTVDKSARAMHRQIAKRAWDFRMAGKSEPLLTAFKEFDALARDLGYGSASELWGAVSTTRKNRNGTDSAKPAADMNGSAKPIVTVKPASAKDRYKALITAPRTFVPGDATMAALLKVSLARISHIRSELGGEGYAIQKADNGFFISPPEPKAVPVEETTIVEAQLPLPAPTGETVAPMGVVATIENVTGMWTETDHSVVVRKLAHIEALLEQLVSEARQQRGIFAQLLQKWS